MKPSTDFQLDILPLDNLKSMRIPWENFFVSTASASENDLGHGETTLKVTEPSPSAI